MPNWAGMTPDQQAEALAEKLGWRSALPGRGAGGAGMTDRNSPRKGMILFHATSRDNLPSILETGLRPSRLGIVYLSPNPELAANFGDAVLEVAVPEELSLTAFDDCEEWEVLCWGHIPAECVKEYLNN